jgi:hypothetical protein
MLWFEPQVLSHFCMQVGHLSVFLEKCTFSSLAHFKIKILLMLFAVLTIQKDIVCSWMENISIVKMFNYPK